MFLATPPTTTLLAPTFDVLDSSAWEALAAISTLVPPIVTTLAWGPVEALRTICFVSSTAIFAPTAALFLIKATSSLISIIQCSFLLDFDESPPLSSLTLFNKKGVTSCPDIFFSLLSNIRLSIIALILLGFF